MRTRNLFTALSLLFCLFTFLGCGGREVVEVSTNETQEDVMAEIFAKELIPTKLKALDTDLLIDFPAEGEVKTYQYTEIVYPYVLQIKVIEEQDIAAAKAAASQDTFQELVTDETKRLVVLKDTGSEFGEYIFWINKTLGEKTFTLTNEGRGWMPRTPAHLAWALKMADTLRLDDSAE